MERSGIGCQCGGAPNTPGHWGCRHPPTLTKSLTFCTNHHRAGKEGGPYCPPLPLYQTPEDGTLRSRLLTGETVNRFKTDANYDTHAPTISECLPKVLGTTLTHNR